jgi:hypothetical protein
MFYVCNRSANVLNLLYSAIASGSACGPISRIESSVPDLDGAWSRHSLHGKPVVSVDKDFRRWLDATQNTLQTGAHVRVEVLRRDVRRLGPLKPIVRSSIGWRERGRCSSRRRRLRTCRCYRRC